MKLKETHCIFPVPDIRKTASWYQEKLGFRREDYLTAEEPHICLYRDGAEIILTDSGGRRVIPNRELYGYGADGYVIAEEQQELQDSFAAAGVKIVRPLTLTDYNNRDFIIEDIDGRWLLFGIKLK